MYFTYLIGAGASAKAIPVVSDFKQKCKEWLISQFVTLTHAAAFEGKIIENDSMIYDSSSFKSADHENFYYKVVDFLEKLEGTHTVDAYAREKYLDNKIDEYERVKVWIDFLICGLHYFPVRNPPIDNRYKLFFGQTLKGGNNEPAKLPTLIKILSWNYDLQFELAAAATFKEDFLWRIHNRLAISPKCFNPINEEYEHTGFEIVKLNGTAGGTIIKHGGKDQFTRETIYNLRYLVSDSLNRMTLENKFFDNFLSYYKNLEANIGNYHYSKTALSYGWEIHSEFAKIARKRAEEIAEQTKVLVILGYSFPEFNKKIDKSIFQKMKPEKIYIQNIPSNIEYVKKRLIPLLPDKQIEIELIDSTNEFFIPYEYDEE